MMAGDRFHESSVSTSLMAMGIICMNSSRVALKKLIQTCHVFNFTVAQLLSLLYKMLKPKDHARKSTCAGFVLFSTLAHPVMKGSIQFDFSDFDCSLAISSGSPHMFLYLFFVALKLEG